MWPTSYRASLQRSGTLWSAWTDGWTGGGLGGPDPVGPHAPLLAIPSWLVDHLPVLPSPTSAAACALAHRQ